MVFLLVIAIITILKKYHPKCKKISCHCKQNNKPEVHYENQNIDKKVKTPPSNTNDAKIDQQVHGNEQVGNNYGCPRSSHTYEQVDMDMYMNMPLQGFSHAAPAKYVT